MPDGRFALVVASSRYTDPTLTQLTDQGGSALTKESVANANLILVSGAINVTAPVPALSTSGLALLAIALGMITAIRVK